MCFFKTAAADIRSILNEYNDSTEEEAETEVGDANEEWKISIFLFYLTFLIEININWKNVAIQFYLEVNYFVMSFL